MNTSHNNIAVVILAAGEGTRMKSDKPKVLHEIKGKTMIEILVDSVIASGVTDKPVVVVNNKHTEIQDTLGDKAVYAIQEEQLGTGHAVSVTQNLLKGIVEKVIVLYGDMPFISPQSIQKLAKSNGSDDVLSVLTATTPDFEGWHSAFKTFGRIVRDEEGKFDRIVEMKDANAEQLEIKELSTCFFCFSADWVWKKLAELDTNNNQKEYYLTDLVEKAKKEGKEIRTVDISIKEVVGINSKEDLENAQTLIA